MARLDRLPSGPQVGNLPHVCLAGYDGRIERLTGQFGYASALAILAAIQAAIISAPLSFSDGLQHAPKSEFAGLAVLSHMVFTGVVTAAIVLVIVFTVVVSSYSPGSFFYRRAVRALLVSIGCGIAAMVVSAAFGGGPGWALALQAQSPDLKTASGYPRMVQKQATSWIERAAEKMPEEEFAFKPDPAVRSFGQILGHVADANYSFCSGVLGENSPSPRVEKTKTTKAELTAALRNAFAYCGRAYDALTDASANETVKAYGQERNKLGVLWFNASHNLEHYGNLVAYMRMKGVVPPSSEPPPK